MRKAPNNFGAIARRTALWSADRARATIVLACAAALILAGQALPF